VKVQIEWYILHTLVLSLKKIIMEREIIRLQLHINSATSRNSSSSINSHPTPAFPPDMMPYREVINTSI
jgi:UDP-N-acetylglucosamine enolpyruvyl transferase